VALVEQLVYNAAMIQQSKDYLRIEQAIHFLEQNADRQPTLKEVADAVCMSEYHFQRVFQRWAGISPKRFLQFLTKEHAKTLLEQSNVLDVSLDSGLSGPGRLHDLFIKCEAMSPGEYKQKGKGLTIEYGFHSSPFGECFLAVSERGVCALHFIDGKEPSSVMSDFRKTWPNAALAENSSKTKGYIERIFGRSKSKTAVTVLCKGTNFQIKVWEALLRIPPGAVVSYQTLAKWVDCPKAPRAVGSAIGRNAIAYLIPCHRVIQTGGRLGGYRWGLARKRAMLAKEAVKA
jgi:AraC family transcriptional regulator of adaptative response/methylated-DNA-[protein]-cysteine methyltransferase